MDVYYNSHRFHFEPTPGESSSGRLLLDQDQRARLGKLLEAEDENWGLDSDGRRLAPDKLFALSPWSARTPDGSLKLLCRFVNLKDGVIIFNTQENYPGDTTAWIYDGAR